MGVLVGNLLSGGCGTDRSSAPVLPILPAKNERIARIVSTGLLANAEGPVSIIDFDSRWVIKFQDIDDTTLVNAVGVHRPSMTMMTGEEIAGKWMRFSLAENGQVTWIEPKDSRQ